MKNITIAGSAVICAAFNALATTDTNVWKLVWSDEFETAGRPDPSKWVYEKGFVRNNELQYYTVDRPENARVENGMLVIEGRREEYPAPDDARSRDKGKTAQYTAASVTTEGKREFLYGRIEVRAKLPSGRGVWPAIWMLGVNRPQISWPRCGEIDIMEFVGHEPEAVHANCHWFGAEKNGHTSKGNTLRGQKPSDDFHIYAIEWDAEKIKFFYDDTNYFTYDIDLAGKGDDNPFRKPQYLLLNFAIGGAWGGQQGVDESVWPQQFLIDYVRYFTKTDEKQ